MARKQQEIKTVSQVRVGDQLVKVSDLDDDKKERLAISLQVTYLNELFRGQVVFYPPPGFEVIRDAAGNITCNRIPIEPNATRGELTYVSKHCLRKS